MKKHVKSILQKVLTAMLCSAFLLPVLPSTDIHTASAETVAANAIYVAPNATGTGSESHYNGGCRTDHLFAGGHLSVQ